MARKNLTKKLVLEQQENRPLISEVSVELSAHS